ncbi:MAG: MoaD/ThiS family protein [Atribacterota bacterium]|jgi:molybdopterin converting factor small subunit|nr:MoaD/ThiS family protein [Atribacterota bacterium]MDD4895876.1 MoaD/ThiS family protein [Atribacterota bacterium]MDD5637647.1 MoaD/ThiS family protein [Atribacterota bacterium]
MKVSIKFYSGFEKYLQDNCNRLLKLNLDNGEDITSILNRFLPQEAIGFVGMVLVNKKITNFDYQLVEGDMVEVFPVIGGG